MSDATHFPGTIQALSFVGTEEAAHQVWMVTFNANARLTFSPKLCRKLADEAVAEYRAKWMAPPEPIVCDNEESEPESEKVQTLVFMGMDVDEAVDMVNDYETTLRKLRGALIHSTLEDAARATNARVLLHDLRERHPRRPLVP